MRYHYAAQLLLLASHATIAEHGRRDQLTDCAAAVAPVDATPIRSPQSVHTAMLPHIAGKELVEIGTRNGDGMTCFSRVTRSAIAVELSRPYCDHLTRRSTEEQNAGRPAWTVLCQDYRSATRLDGDVFTWWQQYPHLRNMHVLLALRRFVASEELESCVFRALFSHLLTATLCLCQDGGRAESPSGSRGYLDF